MNPNRRLLQDLNAIKPARPTEQRFDWPHLIGSLFTLAVLVAFAYFVGWFFWAVVWRGFQ